MIKAFHIFTLLLVAIAMALSLADALELPGKLRLSRDEYLAVQTIYYPGFTWGGFAEVAGLVALAVLLFLLPFRSTGFWLAAASLALLAGSHATYWLVTHSVNGFWLKDVELSGLGGMFFSSASAAGQADWTQLRDIWEYSHVARAAFTLLSFLATAIALAL
jgi:hypothetical protein